MTPREAGAVIAAVLTVLSCAGLAWSLMSARRGKGLVPFAFEGSLLLGLWAVIGWAWVSLPAGLTLGAAVLAAAVTWHRRTPGPRSENRAAEEERVHERA